MNLPALYPSPDVSAFKPFTPAAILRLVEQGVIGFPTEPMQASTTNSVQSIKREQRKTNAEVELKKRGQRMRKGRTKLTHKPN